MRTGFKHGHLQGTSIHYDYDHKPGQGVLRFFVKNRFKTSALSFSIPFASYIRLKKLGSKVYSRKQVQGNLEGELALTYLP
jgi:hypothetical protein